MNIPEMSNEELQTNYSALLVQIDTIYSHKKEFEEEMKKRFRNGGFSKHGRKEHGHIQ